MVSGQAGGAEERNLTVLEQAQAVGIEPVYRRTPVNIVHCRNGACGAL
jgi:hypothetical protein